MHTKEKRAPCATPGFLAVLCCWGIVAEMDRSFSAVLRIKWLRGNKKHYLVLDFLWAASIYPVRWIIPDIATQADAFWFWLVVFEFASFIHVSVTYILKSFL